MYRLNKMFDKHTFSIFYSDLSKVVSADSREYIDFVDKDLARRLVQVLRMHSGELITLFDHAINLDLELAAQMFTTKNRVCGKVLRLAENKQILPKITLMPCILKRDAFQDVIYAAAQMGVTKIVPIISAKVQNKDLSQKDFTRFTSIMISACEQSKNFVIPQLCSPIQINDISSSLKDDGNKILVYFDPAGNCFLDLLNSVQQTKSAEIVMLFGPEGGLTAAEESVVINAGFKSYALTPTILRAKEAVVVGLGGIRCVANS